MPLPGSQPSGVRHFGVGSGKAGLLAGLDQAAEGVAELAELVEGELEGDRLGVVELQGGVGGFGVSVTRFCGVGVLAGMAR